MGKLLRLGKRGGYFLFFFNSSLNVNHVVNPNYEIDLNGLLANSLILVEKTNFLAEFMQISIRRSSGNTVSGNCYFIMGDIVLKGFVLIIVLFRLHGHWHVSGCIGPAIIPNVINHYDGKK